MGVFFWKNKLQFQLNHQDLSQYLESHKESLLKIKSQSSCRHFRIEILDNNLSLWENTIYKNLKKASLLIY